MRIPVRSTIWPAGGGGGGGGDVVCIEVVLLVSEVVGF